LMGFSLVSVRWRRIYSRFAPHRLNHFEHNLDVWRQLWRVCESSDVLMVLTVWLSSLFLCLLFDLAFLAHASRNADDHGDSHVVSTGLEQVVADSRHPMFHLPPSLYRYITDVLKKPLVLILNKVLYGSITNFL
jgi:hypothetical protein